MWRKKKMTMKENDNKSGDREKTKQTKQRIENHVHVVCFRNWNIII